MENTQTALIKISPEADIQVMAFYTEAIKLRDYALTRVIATAEDLKPATDDLTIIARIKKGMEARRKDYLQPFQEHVKEVNEAYKKLMLPIELADSTTRNKIMAFSAEQDRIRREQEEINRLRMEAAQKEASLHNGEISESVNLVEVLPPSPTKTQTDMGSAGMRDNWTYEVVDFALLPNEYKLPDTAMLNAIAKKHHDQKQIPGVKFTNKPSLVVNTR